MRERYHLLVFCLHIKFFQLIRLNAKGQLGVGERCIEADKQGIKLVFCPLGSVEGPWQYEEVEFHLWIEWRFFKLVLFVFRVTKL